MKAPRGREGGEGGGGGAAASARSLSPAAPLALPCITIFREHCIAQLRILQGKGRGGGGGGGCRPACPALHHHLQ